MYISIFCEKLVNRMNSLEMLCKLCYTLRVN